MIIRKFLSLFLALSVVLASCEKPKEEARKASESEKKTNGETKTEASEKETTGKPPALKQWHVSTVAGSTRGKSEGTGPAAQFDDPNKIAVASDGSALYVADTGNHRIRKIALPSGVVTTLAGMGGIFGDRDDTGTAAQFAFPMGIALASDGSTLYVADASNHRIRKVSLPLGVVTTLAGSTQGKSEGTGSAAQFSYPTGIAVASDGSALYVADASNHRIRKVSLPSKVVTTLAGSTQGKSEGTGPAAQFSYPTGIAVASDGSALYVADSSNHRIRKVSLPSKVVTTLAGSDEGHRDATGTTAQFVFPVGIALASDDSALYVADANTHRIRKISLPLGVVTTLAGGSDEGHRDATGTLAQFSSPWGIAVASDGSALYVADADNHRIRKMEFKE